MRSTLFWRRLAAVALVPIALAAAWEQWQLLQTLLARPWANAIDYQVYRAAATIGFQHGWSRIYDPALQQAAIVPLWSHGGTPSWWASSQPFWTPFVSPPPVAWLAAPFNALPAATAGNVWLGLMAAAVVLTVLVISPSFRAAPIYLAFLALTWAGLLSVVSGNVAPLVGLAVVWCWRQAELGHDILAGVMLALASVKPQLIFAVPILLLLAGWRGLFLVWVAGVLALVAVCVATLQSQGVEDFLRLAHLVSGFPAERQLSAPAWAKTPLLGLLTAGTIVVLAVLATRRLRARGPAIPVALGLVASLLLSPYLNFEDFVLLIPAALLLIRLRLGLLIDVLAVALVLSATPASQGFVTPEIVVGLLLLAALASPWLPSRAHAEALRGVAPVRRTPSQVG